MKTVRIITLHLAYGGIEKAVCQMANLFAEKYDVEIISVYDMPDAPAFPIDERVRVRYLLDEIPNRDEWRDCARRKDVFGLARESVRAARILHDKKKAVIDAISAIDDGVIISTPRSSQYPISLSITLKSCLSTVKRPWSPSGGLSK